MAESFSWKQRENYLLVSVTFPQTIVKNKFTNEPFEKFETKSNWELTFEILFSCFDD